MPTTPDHAHDARSADAAPSPAGDGVVVCIGVFDGVHRGHRALIGVARQRADARGLRLVAVTFDPHPMSVVRPGSEPTALATTDHRIALLLDAGADEVDVLHFDSDLAATEAEDFIDGLLVQRLGVREVVVGEDFRFGHRARGTVETLRLVGDTAGFATLAVPLTGGAQRWSSTLARERLVAGDVAGASEVLGRDYRLEGTVVHGDHRGRELGYPTANLSWTGAPTIPADGVYSGWLVVGDDRLPAAISIGTNPQFDGTERRVEAYVIDGVGLDLYGESVLIEFVDRIRGQLTFPDVAGLVARMEQDVEAARAVLSSRA